MKPEPSDRPDKDHQVLPFRPRKTPANSGPGPRRNQHSEKATAPAIESLAKYEAEDDQKEDHASYRHRMMVNIAALLVTVALAVAGGWLAMQIADMRKKQDCVLSGRSNCMRIDTTVPHRPD